MVLVQTGVARGFALGSPIGCIILPMLVVPLLLFLTGRAGSFLFAFYIARWITASIPFEVRQYLRDYAFIPVNYKALLFSIATAVLTGILFGLAPAIEGSRADLNHALKEGSGRGSTGRRGRWIRNSLVGGEMALATALLIAGALLAESFKKIWKADPGFESNGLLAVNLGLSKKEYQDQAKAERAIEAIVARIGSLPGVTAASAAEHIPYGQTGSGREFWMEGSPDPPPGET